MAWARDRIRSVGSNGGGRSDSERPPSFDPILSPRGDICILIRKCAVIVKDTKDRAENEFHDPACLISRNLCPVACSQYTV